MWGEKQSNLKKFGLLAIALLLLIPSFLPVEAYVKVDNTTNSAALHINTQRKLIYYSTGARWFIFYDTGTNYVYKSSTDLTTWSSATTMTFMNGNVTTNVGNFDVQIYGSSVYIAWPDATGNDRIFFANGTISGSTITWSTAKLLITAATTMGAPSITRATTGRIWVSSCNSASPFVDMFRSDDGGTTWATDHTSSFGPACDTTVTGSIMSAMGSGRVMLVAHGNVGVQLRPYFWTYDGAAWSGATAVANVSMPNDHGGFSLVADPYNPDIQYLAVLQAGGTSIRYTRYNSGWSTYENVTTNVDSTSYPVIGYDHTNNRTVVAWIQSDTLFYRAKSIDTGTWGAITQVDSMILVNAITPQHLVGTIREWNNRIEYALVTGNGSPYNVTIAGFSVPATTTTTTTTATVTTLTTQTTTADTILDATTNQFASVMTNFFPAFMIITIFVYIAYKAGASGEVLAYVFIITLVLTSFINLMPWWITLVTAVLMIAIILQYRQSGGAVK